MRTSDALPLKRSYTIADRMHPRSDTPKQERNYMLLEENIIINPIIIVIKHWE